MRLHPAIPALPALALLATAALTAVAGSATALATTGHSSPSSVGPGAGAGTSLAWGRQPLPADDGWAAYSTGTTGGSGADAAHVYAVHDRVGLDSALAGGGSTPKIIYVVGTIDGNTSATGAALTCADYADPGYTLAGYLA